MSNFSYWKEEIADMPEQDEDGNWYDLETGLPFEDSHHYKTGGKTTCWTPSDNVKEHRKVARYYGSKALTGSAKQKEWAEKLRADVLTSYALSDEEKADFLDTANFLGTAKFWINNKDLEKGYFTKENLVKEYLALSALRDKHYDVLVRSGPVGPKEEAKKEIIKQLTENKFQFGSEITFPNFEPFNVWGVFEK